MLSIASNRALKNKLHDKIDIVSLLNQLLLSGHDLHIDYFTFLIAPFCSEIVGGEWWGAEVWEKGLLCSGFLPARFPSFALERRVPDPTCSRTKGSSPPQDFPFFPSLSATAQKVSCSWGHWAPPRFCPTPNAWWMTGRAGHPPSRSVKTS